MQLPSETSEFESPAWHGDVLRETEQRYETGLESSVDWATAKQALYARSGKTWPPLRSPFPATCEWIAAQMARVRVKMRSGGRHRISQTRTSLTAQPC